MKVTRFYADEDGETHFEEVDVPFSVDVKGPPGGGDYRRSQEFAAPKVRFLELPPGRVGDWHNAPEIIFGVVLSGSMHVGTSDGDSREFSVGDMYLAEDVTGKGHISRVLEGPVRLLYVTPPDGYDLTR